MMMILMIIMMVSMVIMMKSEVWKRRLSFLHLSAPECQLKVAVVPLIITRVDHHSADYDHDGQHKKQYLQRLSSGRIDYNFADCDHHGQHIKQYLQKLPKGLITIGLLG